MLTITNPCNIGFPCTLVMRPDDMCSPDIVLPTATDIGALDESVHQAIIKHSLRGVYYIAGIDANDNRISCLVPSLILTAAKAPNIASGPSPWSVGFRAGVSWAADQLAKSIVDPLPFSETPRAHWHRRNDEACAKDYEQCDHSIINTPKAT